MSEFFAKKVCPLHFCESHNKDQRPRRCVGSFEGPTLGKYKLISIFIFQISMTLPMSWYFFVSSDEGYIWVHMTVTKKGRKETLHLVVKRAKLNFKWTCFQLFAGSVLEIDARSQTSKFLASSWKNLNGDKVSRFIFVYLV